MTDIYAVPGSNEQHIGKPKFAPDGVVEMSIPRPSLSHVAQADGTWTLDPLMVAEEAEAEAKHVEKNTGQFANLTMAQAETWIDGNVTDLASAKNALKKIVRLILART